MEDLPKDPKIAELPNPYGLNRPDETFMKKLSLCLSLAAVSIVSTMAVKADPEAGNGLVMVTPLGTHDGEFCRRDRALLFEDPDGTTILWDPGRTVRGPTDERLPAGGLTGVILSSVHSDHLGDRIPSAQNNGNCDNPTLDVDLRPASNTTNILIGHMTAVMRVGGEMPSIINKKVGRNAASTLRPGGNAMIGGVGVAVIAAFHSNGLSSGFITDESHKSELAADGLTGYGGLDHGYILRFTNGLVVYLTGDTGHFGDMKHIVRDFYKPKLMVVNLGNGPSMGPEEGAFAVKLVRPKSVIPSHTNDRPGTIGGVPAPGSQMEAFSNLVEKADVHIPLSGVTMMFNKSGRCVNC